MTEDQYILKARKKVMTRRQFATKLSYKSLQLVYSIETGKSKLPVKHFTKVSKLLNIDKNKLIKLRVKSFEKELREKVK